ncbi:hypothetical protein Ppa06_16890 [Planomonospora parontospora subsp. parontospora]|uniref:Protein-glutamine gamma-glutamyltransferase-like C-terminal domain-containing protein n=2 Tax=Planomonospora parontospora TaxID=58119 RepID=A0AA37F3C0_9ACTN|nr:hypothetical protein GCM10010126_17440 [Planomonospora parontospora]GII07891.1 hypothetical protein Ppa06_16890 [Planomonospora parontospora subsp. parontospora]
MAAVTVPPVVPLTDGVPVDIARDAAREAAVRELARPIYPRESWWERISGAVRDWLEDLLDAASGLPGGWFSILLLAFVILLVALPVLSMARRATRARTVRRGELFEAAVRSAAEHRAEAERHAAGQRWAEAIRERLRAVARDLEERAVVEELPGRTADELAAEAGRALPGFAGELTAAARLFDDVTYGDLPGTAEGYGRLADLDDRLRTARPVLSGHPGGTP